MTLHNVAAGRGLSVIKIEGELDFASAPAVQSALPEAAKLDGLKAMLIDLADVSAADNVGVAALAAGLRKMLHDHPRMRVFAVSRDRRLTNTIADESGCPLEDAEALASIGYRQVA